MSASATQHLAVLLAPGFPLMAFAALLEPLRAANRIAGKPLYAWSLASTDGRAVQASNGIPIGVNAAIAEIGQPARLVVCAGLDPLGFIRGEARLRRQLPRLAARGCEIGGISGGPYVLAETGLLDGKRCTVHWEYAEDFRARYPRARLLPDLYVRDGRIFTCSGGTAALDLMLAQIRHDHGPGIALAVAEQFIHPGIRSEDAGQRLLARSRIDVPHARLAEAVQQMETRLGEPLDLDATARAAGISTRQLQRLFARHLGCTPAAWHQGLRLAQARHLLRETVRPVREIAQACGFCSLSHFSHAYRRAHGCRPSDERRPGAGRSAA